jgi:uncharacterized protein (DUF1330 family)
MAKVYWIMTFRSLTNQAGLDRYVAIADPVIRAKGGKVLTAGVPAFVFEAGIPQRVAVVEFASLDKARAAYESAEYQEAVQSLVGAAERDVRIIAGM